MELQNKQKERQAVTWVQLVYVQSPCEKLVTQLTSRLFQLQQKVDTLRQLSRSCLEIIIKKYYKHQQGNDL